MSLILGFDIGGANTKYVVGSIEDDNFKVKKSDSLYFPFWKDLSQFPDFLLKIKQSIENDFGPITKVVFVTTAELADCFDTKKEGIEAIFTIVNQIFEAQSPVILDVYGNFLEKDEAVRKWLDVSASNWYASAKLIGQTNPNSIVIDIGSTTTDITPIFEGDIISSGRTDLDRLINGELVYSGLLRTNVIAITNSVLYQRNEVPLASELFATTGDIYLILDGIDSAKYTVPTCDGKPATKEFSRSRLAKIVCADKNQLNDNDIHYIARQIRDKHLTQISDAFVKILELYHSQYKINPKIVLIGSGVDPIGIPLVRKNGIYDEIIASDILDKSSLNNFCAFATIMLYLETRDERL